MVKPDTITQCKNKNQRAFKALYEASLPYVFTIVKGYTENPDSRKDLIQEIFAKVFLNIKKFDAEKGEFKFWLRKVTVNHCLMFLRDKKKHFEMEDLESVSTSSNLKESINLSHLDPNITDQLLSKMPDGYRKVFSLVVFEGYSHDEVGEKLGISTETSRSQLSRSKKWLRHFLSNNKTLMNNGFC